MRKKGIVLAAVTSAAMLALSAGTVMAEETVSEEAVSEEVSSEEASSEFVFEDFEAETETETEPIVRPEITALDYVELGEYKGLETTVEEATVSDEEVEASILSEIESAGIYPEDEDGTVDDGDIANIDYVGKIDGEAFDGGTDSGYDLTIGSGTFIEGFEEGLIGAKVGDVVDVPVTFPEDYYEELAGKDAVFTVTVNAVKHEAQMTDDVIAELTGEEYKTVDDYAAYMNEYLLDAAKEDQESMISENLWQLVTDNSTVKEIPQELLDYETAVWDKQYEMIASMYGMSLEDMITTMYGIDMDEYNEIVAENTAEMAKRDLLINAVAESEDLLLADDELQEALEAQAEEYGTDLDTLLAYYSEDELKAAIIEQNVMTFIRENAQVREVSAEELTEGMTE